MPDTVFEEVRKMIVATTHRYTKVRQIAVKYLNAILTSFAALMCDRKIVFTLLEVLTLLRRSCEDELVDEVCDRNTLCCRPLTPCLRPVFFGLQISLGQARPQHTPHGRFPSSKFGYSATIRTCLQMARFSCGQSAHRNAIHTPGRLFPCGFDSLSHGESCSITFENPGIPSYWIRSRWERDWLCNMRRQYLVRIVKRVSIPSNSTFLQAS